MSPTQHNEMINEYESWEHLIREDIERLDTRLRNMHFRMGQAGIPEEARTEFIRKTLIALIFEIGGTVA